MIEDKSERILIKGNMVEERDFVFREEKDGEKR